MLLLVSRFANAEPITSMVEFFSFRCSHCANINQKVAMYVKNHDVQFTDINVDNNELALPTTIMYYIAQDAEVGAQFKTAYFEAVKSGMPAYGKDTLAYVYKQTTTLKFATLLKSSAEKESIKQKLGYVNQLLGQYHIQATPTFLINQSILLEGEDVINSLQ
jgi:protein-disulfide isomerase